MHSGLIVVAHLVLLAIGVWLLVIDARSHRLPNRIVLPALAGVIVLVCAEALWLQDAARLLRSMLGMLLLGGFYLLLRLASRRGIGGGDVKLAALIGAVLGWHGWTQLAVGAVAAFVLASGFALVLMALRRADRKTRIAFGPWMILGAALAIALV